MNNNNIDDFLNELYENWIDIVIDNVPLVQNFNRNNAQFSSQTRIYQTRYTPIQRPGINNNVLDIYNIYRNLENTENVSSNNELINGFVTLMNNRRNIRLFNTNVSQQESSNRNETQDEYQDISLEQNEQPRTPIPSNNSPIVENNPQPDLSNLITDLFGNTYFGNSLNYLTELLFEDVKVTLTEEDFNKLKVIKLNDHNINEYKDKECNICLDNYKNNDELKILPCNHLFHSNCIHNWLCNEKITCPICRKDIREN